LAFRLARHSLRLKKATLIKPGNQQPKLPEHQTPANFTPTLHLFNAQPAEQRQPGTAITTALSTLANFFFFYFLFFFFFFFFFFLFFFFFFSFFFFFFFFFFFLFFFFFFGARTQYTVTFNVTTPGLHD